MSLCTLMETYKKHYQLSNYIPQKRDLHTLSPTLFSNSIDGANFSATFLPNHSIIYNPPRNHHWTTQITFCKPISSTLLRFQMHSRLCSICANPEYQHGNETGTWPNCVCVPSVPSWWCYSHITYVWQTPTNTHIYTCICADNLLNERISANKGTHGKTLRSPNHRKAMLYIFANNVYSLAMPQKHTHTNTQPHSLRPNDYSLFRTRTHTYT